MISCSQDGCLNKVRSTFCTVNLLALQHSGSYKCLQISVNRATKKMHVIYAYLEAPIAREFKNKGTLQEKIMFGINSNKVSGNNIKRILNDMENWYHCIQMNILYCQRHGPIPLTRNFSILTNR